MGRHSKPEESTTSETAEPTTEGRHAAHASEASSAGEIRSATNNWGVWMADSVTGAVSVAAS